MAQNEVSKADVRYDQAERKQDETEEMDPEQLARQTGTYLNYDSPLLRGGADGKHDKRRTAQDNTQLLYLEFSL